MVGDVRGKGEKAERTRLPRAKKPYRRPVLSTLGTLRDMTMAKGFNNSDGTTMRGVPTRTGRGGRSGRSRERA